MNTQSILDEVERRVAERLPAVLFERGILLHAKRSFSQGCDCEYCKIKREATFRVGNMPIKFEGLTTEDRRERKEKIRERFRVIYREKLKAALNEV